VICGKAERRVGRADGAEGKEEEKWGEITDYN
jgi:hypothetical protein